MNSTVISSNDVQNNQQGKIFNIYIIGVWLVLLVFIIIATYYSYICARSRSRLSSTTRSYSVTVTNTTQNNAGVDEISLTQYPKLLYVDLRVDHHGPTASGCSICLADYKGCDMIRILPECGHIFHLNCIDPWLRMHATCPICRTPPRPTPLATPLAEGVPLATIHA